MAFWSHSEAYRLEDDDSSDNSIITSSEDEIDIILHGTPEQRKRLKNLHKRIDDRKRGNDEKSSSSEDEFEKEMNAELTQHIDFIENSRDVTGRLCGKPADKQPTTYDDVYFDSDEEGDDITDSRQEGGKHAVISNDDLLYDPSMDDRDQRWVDRQRRRNNNTTSLQPNRSQTQTPNKRKKPAKLPSSDALLDCPACLTTLCLDCQRHDTYKHQYRAMFVMNCVVDSTQMLECPDQQTKRKKRKKKTVESESQSDVIPSSAFDAATATASNGASSGSDLFHPVKCTECNTVVGVIDSEDVYHFFNVLASHT